MDVLCGGGSDDEAQEGRKIMVDINLIKGDRIYLISSSLLYIPNLIHSFIHSLLSPTVWTRRA